MADEMHDPEMCYRRGYHRVLSKFLTPSNICYLWGKA